MAGLVLTASAVGLTARNDAEKAMAILEFLLDEGEGSKRCLVVIGAGGSGKTRALHAAMHALPHDVYGCMDVHVWNHGELPKPSSYRHGSGAPGCPEKWVVLRRGDDALTRALVEEWVGCGLCGHAVRFRGGESAEDLAGDQAHKHL